MAVAALYMRVLIEGEQRYTKAVFQGNGNLKPNHCLIDGKPQRFPEGVYHLRFAEGGKRRWESLRTSDASLAIQRYRVKLNSLESSPSVQEHEPEPEPEPEVSAPSARAVSLSLNEVIADYLSETKAQKSKKTLAAYTTTLTLFRQSCTKDRLDALTRKDALDFATFLRKRGNAERTVRNRVDFLQIFLHHYKLPSLLTGKDKPKFTEKRVRSYNGFELQRMMDAANEDERDLLLFFVCTVTREQEAQYACWSDVDLTAKAYTVTEHVDLGFRPKDKEEGSVALADVLVDRLKARRKRYPKTRLIFPGANGKPDGHMLRIIKRLALTAGANCGHCVNKAGKSCADHPVCKGIFLHKLRKTYATTLHRNGVPARTIQSFLRHSSLETTLRYLADVQDEQTVQQVNSAFGGFGGAL
jgi:integrase/recombinase XerD